MNILLVPTLLTKMKRSQIGLDSTKPAFDQLTNSCRKRKLPIDLWKSEEHLAMEERGEGLAIFDINHEKAPTLAEITLKLTDGKESRNISASVVDWISDGIKAQNDQFVLNNADILVLY